jgi:uncharacterized membrane protein
MIVLHIIQRVHLILDVFHACIASFGLRSCLPLLLPVYGTLWNKNPTASWAALLSIRQKKYPGKSKHRLMPRTP